MSSKTLYLEGIKKLILSNKDFGIEEVKELEYLKGLDFVREDYPKILELVKKKEIEQIKHLPEKKIKSFEDLTVLKFFDENNKTYIVLVYETDELWQDPIILDLVPQ